MKCIVVPALDFICTARPPAETIGMSGLRRQQSTESVELYSAVLEQRRFRLRKEFAAQIIESFWTDAGRGAERLKLRNDHATIGDLIERYRLRHGQGGNIAFSAS